MIEFQNVTKKYRKTIAVNNFNLRIEKNELFGFVGPMGAGKTTLMRMICGVLSPTSGRCLIDGVDVTKEPLKVKRMVGYVPDVFGVYDNLRVIEYMKFFASAYGLIGNEADRTCAMLLDMVKLDRNRYSYVDELSRVMKQRLCVARALIHEPKILVLDEPMTRLDAKCRIELKEFLRMLNVNGKTILITSHILQEVTELCTGMVVLESGKSIISGNMKEIESQMHSVNPIVMKVSLGGEYAVSVLKSSSNVKNLIISEEDEFYIDFEGSTEEEAELLSRVVAAGAMVSSFSRKGHNMESVFLKIME